MLETNTSHTLSAVKDLFSEQWPLVTQVVDVFRSRAPQEQPRRFAIATTTGRVQVETDGNGRCLDLSISFPTSQHPSVGELVDVFGAPTKTSGVRMLWETRGSFRAVALAEARGSNAKVITIGFTHSPAPVSVPKGHWDTQVSGTTYSSLPLLAKMNSQLVLLCFTAELKGEEGVWEARISDEWMALDPDTRQTVAYSKSVIPLPVEAHLPVVVQVEQTADYPDRLSDLASTLRAQRERRDPWIASGREEVVQLQHVVGGMFPLYQAVLGETP